MKSRPMIRRFCSGSVIAVERGVHLLGGVDVHDAHAEIALERVEHLRRLVLPQEP
jgi:hypothetical protein